MSHQTIVNPHNIKYIPVTPIPLTVTPHIYGFDLDHTLIKPKTPNTIFAKTADDWKYMQFTKDEPAIEKLFKIVEKDPLAIIVIFTNQGGVLTVPANSKSYNKFNMKIKLILEDIMSHKNGEELLRRLWIYSSTKKPASLKKANGISAKKGKVMKLTDLKGVKSSNSASKPIVNLEDKFTEMRKPEVGLYKEFMKDFKEKMAIPVDLKCWKWYCGDAAGRKSDFSDSDKAFAENIGIRFKLPEDIFI
ncbi:polynucleotide 3'-phosphatase [Monosporozyma unispora]|nr:hypothetical protein C6P44_004857 [Kazachstania unispora]